MDAAGAEGTGCAVQTHGWPIIVAGRWPWLVTMEWSAATTIGIWVTHPPSHSQL